MISNRIRFSGMASGMDTDSIVKDMMRPQQYKIDAQKKAQALLQLKQDAWKDMNTKLYDFHTKFTHKMSQDGTFNTSKTNISNENAISISNAAQVPKGTHNFKVIQLATSISVTGGIDTEQQLDKDTTVGQLLGSEVKWEPVVGEDGIPKPLKRTLSMNVSGALIKFEVEENDTLASVATKMNTAFKNDKTGFVANYDAENGKFFINSSKTGEGQTIEFLEDTAGLFDKLGLKESAVKGGQDAKYQYNAFDENDTIFTSPTNEIKINGIKATLKAKTAVDEIVTITSGADPDATYAVVKEFITEYNKLIDEINTKLGTKPGKNIQPLTAEERKGMSESEIKLWEDKLNSSLFYKDEQLTDFTRVSRNVLGGQYLTGKEYKVDGVTKADPLMYTTLASLGIVTGTWQERGKLYISGDEDNAVTNKLKEAIAANPDEVAAFFAKLGDELYKTHNESIKSSDLKSAFNFYNDKTMTKKMQDYDKTIASLEERMYRMEEMQYKKFAAMEKMLSTLNSQGSWLSQQFGG